MIHFQSGNLLRDNSEAIVNTVNCVGVMGRGIALQFKNEWPENFKAYEKACKKQEIIPGKMFIFETAQTTHPRYIINFPTKRHWREKSRINDIELGLADLRKEIIHRGIQSIAIPPLGAGLGGLNWKDVKERIINSLADLPEVQIRVYEPNTMASERLTTHVRDVPKMTSGRAALIELMKRYSQGLLDPFITLLEIHKLMYFMQVSGQPLKLKFEKGFYGPYAANLSHVLIAVEGHFISGYFDGGDDPRKALFLMPGATEKAENVLLSDLETKGNFDRVSDLVDGFESPMGLELLSTVHWVVNNNRTNNLEDVHRLICEWSSRKKKLFTPHQVKIAYDILQSKNWI